MPCVHVMQYGCDFGAPASLFCAFKNVFLAIAISSSVQLQPFNFNVQAGKTDSNEADMSLKRGERYSDVVGFIRRRLRFDLLRTFVIALRGFLRRTQLQPQRRLKIWSSIFNQ